MKNQICSTFCTLEVQQVHNINYRIKTSFYKEYIGIRPGRVGCFWCILNPLYIYMCVYIYICIYIYLYSSIFQDSTQNYRWQNYAKIIGYYYNSKILNLKANYIYYILDTVIGQSILQRCMFYVYLFCTMLHINAFPFKCSPSHINLQYICTCWQ